MKYTKKALEEAARNSISVSGVMRHLGIQYISGSMHGHISGRLERCKIDTAHFKGQGHLKGGHSPRRKSAEEICVLRTKGRRTKRKVLYRALMEFDVPCVCQKCGLKPFWQNEELTLHIDHINGSPLDDRKENLRFLCPNCHAQTITFGNHGAK